MEAATTIMQIGPAAAWSRFCDSQEPASRRGRPIERFNKANTRDETRASLIEFALVGPLWMIIKIIITPLFVYHNTTSGSNTETQY